MLSAQHMICCFVLSLLFVCLLVLFCFAFLFFQLVIWYLFLESPETFRVHLGWHNSLCIFKTKASRGTTLYPYIHFYSLYNMWKDQLHRISRLEFYEWLFGPEKLSGLSRNGPLARISEAWLALTGVNYHKEVSSVFTLVITISQPKQKKAFA